MEERGLVTVVPDGGAPGVPLAVGESLTFGRSVDDGQSAEPHLGLSHSPSLHGRAGTITAADRGWVLVNTGRWLQLRVLHLDGPERVDLAPGHTLIVPWAQVRVEMVTRDGVVGFAVSCPAVVQPVEPVSGGDTVGGLGLDRSAGYFRALVALCEPRLRDPGSDVVPGSSEIARRLNGSGGESQRVTAKAVERRLAYLRSRLGVGGEVGPGGSAEGMEVRDAARRLVDLAVRSGAVKATDLSLLGPVQELEL